MIIIFFGALVYYFFNVIQLIINFLVRSPIIRSKTFYPFLAAIIATGLVSCATPLRKLGNSPLPQAQLAQTPDLKVVTTTLPLTNFTKAVAGDQAAVTYLLPANAGPHDYQAKPESVRTLAEADVLVKNGLGLEAYLDDPLASANNQDLRVIDTSQGIETITHEAEGHDPEEKTAGEEHKHEGQFNPHIWLDPERAIQQVENIRDGLIAADPEGQDTYTANAAAYITKLKALDAEIVAALKSYAGKEFVTYHDFAPYFAQRYDLKAEYLVGVPEENPAPVDVQRVMNAAQASDLKTLLAEPQAAGNSFTALANDLKVRVSTFDPMETSGPEGLQPDYYLKVMRQNVKNLQTAFSGKSMQSRLPVWMPTAASVTGVAQPTRLGLHW